MKVVVSDLTDLKAVRQLPTGAVFISGHHIINGNTDYEGEKLSNYCMVIVISGTLSDNEHVRVVDLETGIAFSMNPDTMVLPVDSTLTIKRKTETQVLQMSY